MRAAGRDRRVREETAVKLEKINLGKILENSYNPNHMDDAAFDALARAIREHGYVQPILVRRVGDGYEVVDGAHRLRALKLLGYGEAECVVVDASDRDARMRTLVMNRLRGRMDSFETARILEDFDREEIGKFLAFSEKDIDELKGLLSAPARPPLEQFAVKPALVVEFLLTREEAAQVEAALAAAGCDRREDALLAICRHYPGSAGKTGA